MRSPTFPALPPWMLQSGCGFTPQDKSGEWSVQWRYHPLSGLPSALAARLSHASHSGNASDDAAALDSTASKPGPYKGKFSNVVPPFLWEVLKCARGARFLHYYNEREWESVYDSHYSGNRVKMTFPAPPPTFSLSGVNLEQRICRKNSAVYISNVDCLSKSPLPINAPGKRPTDGCPAWADSLPSYVMSLVPRWIRNESVTGDDWRIHL